METITIEYQSEIAILKLDNGVSNTITPQMVADLSDTLKRFETDDNVRGLVLTSANEKFFSIGFDIPNLYPLPPDEFGKFFSAFNQLSIQLYSILKPTIAAIPGHAIAGGCILALCCDYRTISAGRKLMGLNEIKLGAPVPYPVDCMLRDLIGSHKARQVMEFGEFYALEEALQLGMVDQITSPEGVIPASVERIQQITANPAKAFAVIKQNRTQPVLDQINTRLEQVRDDFSACWYSEETRQRLEEAIEKF